MRKEKIFSILFILLSIILSSLIISLIFSKICLSCKKPDIENQNNLLFLRNDIESMLKYSDFTLFNSYCEKNYCYLELEKGGKKYEIIISSG